MVTPTCLIEDNSIHADISVTDSFCIAILTFSSGKCQIIHWRQGHKEECHPPKTSDWTSEEENDSEHKLADQHHCGSYEENFDTDSGQHVEPDKTLNDGLASPNYGFSGGSPPSGKDVSMELHADGKENSPLELRDTTFYKSHTSTLSSESSADAPVSESSSQSDTPRSDGYLSAQASFDQHYDTSGVSIVDPKQPLSPSSAHLVNSVDRSAKLKIENHPSYIRINPDDDARSSASKVKGIGGSCEGSINEICFASSGFQEKNGNSIGPRGNDHEDSIPSSIDGANNRNISERNSFLHFSFSLSRGTSQSNVQVAEVHENVADGNLRTTLGSNRTTGSTLISDINVESLKARNSPSSCEGSQDKDNTAKELSDLRVVNSTLSSSSCTNLFPVSRAESRSVRGDSNTSMSVPLELERSCPVSIEPGNTSNISKRSGGIGSLSVDDSSAHLPSIIGGESVPPSHSRKGTIQVGAGVSSLDANFSSNPVYGFRHFVHHELRRSKSDRSYAANGSEIARRYSNKVIYLFIFV